MLCVAFVVRSPTQLPCHQQNKHTHTTRNARTPGVSHDSAIASIGRVSLSSGENRLLKGSRLMKEAGKPFVWVVVLLFVVCDGVRDDRQRLSPTTLRH